MLEFHFGLSTSALASHHRCLTWCQRTKPLSYLARSSYLGFIVVEQKFASGSSHAPSTTCFRVRAQHLQEKVVSLWTMIQNSRLYDKTYLHLVKSCLSPSFLVARMLIEMRHPLLFHCSCRAPDQTILSCNKSITDQFSPTLNSDNEEQVFLGKWPELDNLFSIIAQSESVSRFRITILHLRHKLCPPHPAFIIIVHLRLLIHPDHSSRTPWLLKKLNATPQAQFPIHQLNLQHK